jgi:hypothetical protein
LFGSDLVETIPFGMRRNYCLHAQNVS